jgi:hypothetical protein
MRDDYSMNVAKTMGRQDFACGTQTGTSPSGTVSFCQQEVTAYVCVTEAESQLAQ